MALPFADVDISMGSPLPRASLCEAMLSMNNTLRRLGRTFFKYGFRMLTLLLAVSIIAFALVSYSPIDPVQQYILGLGTAVSPEQRAEIEDYWGMDEPPVQRYLHWLGRLLQGDMGQSLL